MDFIAGLPKDKLKQDENTLAPRRGITIVRVTEGPAAHASPGWMRSARTARLKLKLHEMATDVNLA
jgi:hypothetical protein